jgi:hypothetical protein
MPSVRPPTPPAPESALAAETPQRVHLKETITAPNGLRLTLLDMTVEDVAADPGSGSPAYGMVVANIELDDGRAKRTVTFYTPRVGVAPRVEPFGTFGVALLESFDEYAKRPGVVVRVTGRSAAPTQ